MPCAPAGYLLAYWYIKRHGMKLLISRGPRIVGQDQPNTNSKSDSSRSCGYGDAYVIDISLYVNVHGCVTNYACIALPMIQYFLSLLSFLYFLSFPPQDRALYLLRLLFITETISIECRLLVCFELIGLNL